MCKVLGVAKTRKTAMRPQSDGMVERANRTIENMLSSFVNKHQNDWGEYIPLLILAHRSSGLTPSKIMFGREVNFPVDLVFGKPDKIKTLSPNEFV